MQVAKLLTELGLVMNFEFIEEKVAHIQEPCKCANALESYSCRAVASQTPNTEETLAVSV